MNTNKKAVVYVRVSTQYQVDNYSVQDQRSLASLAARYGFAEVEVREEQGVSAETITARPVMKTLLEEIANGTVGAIIVSSFTRLTRDIDDIDGRIIKKTCRDHDCVIITPEKLYDFSNEADDDLADLQFFFSKIQKRMNLKPMIRGEYTKAKNGGFVGLPLSVGYAYEWKAEISPQGTRYVADLMINEEEVQVVRHIHELFPTHLYRPLAAHLNELAAKGEMIYFPIKQLKLQEKYGATHRPWRIDDIRRVIQNDLYVGRLQYAVNSKSTYLRGLEPVFTYRQELRILPDDVFERNQKIAAQRQAIHPRSKASPHIFSGILRCPLCGARMIAKRQVRNRTSGPVIEYSYHCDTYSKSGPSACPGYLLHEKAITPAILSVFADVLQKNIREHLQNTSAKNPLNEQIEGEIRAELAKINRAIKNLVEAVKEGALSMEQVKEENAELQDAKRRLEKRVNDLGDVSRIADQISEVLDSFEEDLEAMLYKLMADRLRFNTFIRVFFAELVLEVDRPGCAWKKGTRKGELPIYNPRLVKFALTYPFASFVDQSGLELPDSLKRAQRQSPVYLSERKGSP